MKENSRFSIARELQILVVDREDEATADLSREEGNHVEEEAVGGLSQILAGDPNPVIRVIDDQERHAAMSMKKLDEPHGALQRAPASLLDELFSLGFDLGRKSEIEQELRGAD